MSEKDGVGPTDIANAKEIGNMKETMNPAKDATNVANPVNATAADNTKKGGVSRSEAVLNEKDVDKAKHRGDQRDGPARKCGCACDINCNCKCTCACRDHCTCRIRPCDGNCGSRVGRNLVISIDGTSNQFGIHNTNVVELHSRILSETSANQNKYYNCGIGTYVPPEAKASWKYWSQRVNNMVDLAIAINFKDIILKAYKWLSQTYLPGDKIFIFGFSRGAYQVRTLAAMIEKVGLVDSGNEEMIPFAYEIYTERHKGKVSDEAEEIAAHFKNTFSRDVRVHFAGLWDTVSSVGLVRGKPLPLTWSAKHICILRHALALDERRVKFLPEYVAGGGSSPASLNSEHNPASAGGSNAMSWDVKEVWFPGTHSDIGGGIKKNIKLNLSSVPLLWMENEATSAGLRLRPRAAGGGWNLSEFHQDDVHESLRGFWRLIEHIPLKHLTYNDPDAVTRTPHRGNGRVIVPGQRIHVSVAFKTKGYTPRATFLHDTHIKWASFVGKDIGNHSFDWAGRLGNEVEMDLFDASFMIQAIDELREIQTKEGSASHPAAPSAQSYWVKRLEFMALSGQLASNYLAKLEQIPPEKKAKEIHITVDLFQKLRQKHPDTFDPDVATLLEYETGVLFGGQDVDGALHSYQEAQNIRLNIARVNKASARGIDILANCIRRLSESSDTLKSNNDALTAIQDSVKSRQVLTGVDPNQPLANSLHYIGVVLRSLGHHEDALQAATEAVGLYQELARKNPATNPTGKKDLGSALHSLGISLSMLGRHEEALPHKEEAVRLCRKLAVTEPTAKKDLASSLRNLGIDLSAVGRHQEALGADEQAVVLCHELVETDPTITKDLVQSLHNLGFDFSALDRNEDAVHSEEEAVSRCRNIVGSDPSITKYLANSLHSLGFYLARVGRHEAAVVVTAEAVGLRRNLAEADSTTTADLLESLHNLGFELKTVGRDEDMLDATHEAIQISRKLVEKDPGEKDSTAMKDLASSLLNLGLDLSMLGRHRDAVGADEEAVKICRRLAEKDLTIMKDLAWGLHNLGVDLSHVGRHKDAVGADEEAVEIRRRLAEKDPTIMKDLAWALHNLGVDLSHVGRHEDAVGANEEAVKIRRRLAEMDSSVIPDLSHSLSNLGVFLSNVGRHDDAVGADEEAVEIRRRLVQTDPTIMKDLALALYNLGAHLSHVGRHEDAVGAGKEAVEIRRRLAEKDPTIMKDLAWALHNLGVHLSHVGRHREAVGPAEAAVKIRRRLAETDPSVLPDLSHSLSNLGMFLSNVGRYEDAVGADEEAVEIRRRLAEKDPAVTKDLAWVLHNLGSNLSHVGRHREAVGFAEEVVKIRRKLAETDPSAMKDLGQSLHILAIYLNQVGHPEDAVCVGEEAAGIHRMVAETDAAGTQALAGSLHNLGNNFRIIGRHEAALGVTEEAVELYRKLADMDSLADVLPNLGFDLSAVNRHEDAVRVNEEAIELFDKVAEPTAQMELNLAAALHGLAASLRAVGRHGDAASSDEKGAVIYRKRVETDPEDAAFSLHELAVDFRSIGLHDDARRSEDGAVELYRKLVQTNPALVMRLALCLELLAGDLHALGREEEAVDIDVEVANLKATTPGQAPSSSQARDPAESQRALTDTPAIKDAIEGEKNGENDHDSSRALGRDADAELGSQGPDLEKNTARNQESSLVDEVIEEVGNSSGGAGNRTVEEDVGDGTSA